MLQEARAHQAFCAVCCRAASSGACFEKLFVALLLNLALWAQAEPEPARDFIKANTMAAIRNESAGPRRVGSAKGSQGQQRGSSRGSPRLSLGGDAGAGAGVGAGAGEASSGTAGAAALNKNFGRVPQYLVDRKIEKAEQEAAKCVLLPTGVPSGSCLVSACFVAALGRRLRRLLRCLREW
jgi:hypothetical protein